MDIPPVVQIDQENDIVMDEVNSAAEAKKEEEPGSEVLTIAEEEKSSQVTERTRYEETKETTYRVEIDKETPVTHVTLEETVVQANDHTPLPQVN